MEELVLIDELFTLAIRDLYEMDLTAIIEVDGKSSEMVWLH